MKSVNKVILMGHLGQDPVVRYSTSGRAVTSFSLATNRQYTKGDGEKVEEAEWHRMVAFSKLGELAGQLLNKGACIYVEGRLRPTKWKDKAGSERRSHEIWMDSFQIVSRKKDNLTVALNDQEQIAEADIPF